MNFSTPKTMLNRICSRIISLDSRHVALPVISLLSGMLFWQMELPAESLEQPNIVVFLVDDLGYDDLGASGNAYVESPRIDSLKDESVFFENFSVAPACAPTRASFLTGRDWWRTGVTHVHGGGDYLNLDETTIADVLNANGYRTGMWGKWHSGKSPGYFPWDRGFDEGFYSELYKHENALGWKNGKFLQSKEWSPQLIGDMAVDFITADSGKPFFAFLSFLAVHEPIYAPEADVQHFLKKGYPIHLCTIYAMVKSVDNQVGRVLDTVERTGRDRETIIVFFSDNGPTNGNTSPLGIWPEDVWNTRNQWHQFRGRKGEIWENGIRVPLYIRWRGHFEPGTKRAAVSVNDLFPTLVSLSQSNLSGSAKPIDGQDISGILFGEAETRPGSVIGHSITPFLADGTTAGYHPIEGRLPELYPFDKQSLYIKKGHFKLMLNPDGTSNDSKPLWFLADLEKDPRELKNCLSEHAELFTSLREELEHWYRNLWQNEGNFHRPTFFIGQEDDSRSKVNAFGPTRLLGKASNTDHYLHALNTMGDGAEWDVLVSTAGTYELEIDHQDDAPASELCMRISIQGQSNEFRISSGNMIPAGKFELEKGPATIRFEVVDNPDKTGKGISYIRHLTFFNTSLTKNNSRYPW